MLLAAPPTPSGSRGIPEREHPQPSIREAPGAVRFEHRAADHVLRPCPVQGRGQSGGDCVLYFRVSSPDQYLHGGKQTILWFRLSSLFISI